MNEGLKNQRRHVTPTYQRVILLNRPYRVACPDDKVDELNATVALLNEQLAATQKGTGLTGRDDIIMMTALNLCHQLLAEQNIE